MDLLRSLTQEFFNRSVTVLHIILRRVLICIFNKPSPLLTRTSSDT